MKRAHFRHLTTSILFFAGLSAGLEFAPQASAAEAPIGFAQALDTILKRNLSIATQATQLRGAEALVFGAKAAFLPSINGQAQVSTADALGEASTSRSASTEGVAKLNLFKFGADISALRGAQAQTRSETSRLEDSVLRAEEDGVTALINVIARRKEIELESKIVQARSESLKIARTRYERGYLALEEVRSISIDYDNAQATLRDTQIRELAARTTLTALLGHSEIESEWPWKTRLSQDKGLLTRLSDFSLERRPDWLGARHALEASEHEVDRRYRSLFPSLDASFTYGYYSTEAVKGTAWTATAGLSIPLFNRLQDYTSYRLGQFARTRAEIELERVQREALALWENAKAEYITALDTSLARDRTLELSKNVYEANLKRFQAGRLDSNDLAIDLARFLQSELNAVQGWSEVHLAFTRLCHALGRQLERCL